MRILITNDDGINALGIRLLAEWAKKLGEVTVIPPKREQSAISHAIDLVNPIEVKKLDFVEGVTAYSMDSTPADCIRFAMLGLKEKFDLVLSGINHGINVGIDLVYSGTIGAAFETARYGIPSVAISAFPNGVQAAVEYLDEVYGYFLKNRLFQENLIYNVNIPIKSRGIRMTYEGSAYYADEFVKVNETSMYKIKGEPKEDEYPTDLNRDTVAIHQGYITVTPLLASRTNVEVFRKFQTEDRK